MTVTSEERAALVEKLRTTYLPSIWAAADLIEADGKRLEDIARERDDARHLVDPALEQGLEAVRQKKISMKHLALAEKTIERIRLHRAQLGSSLVGFPDGYERALAEYDAAKEAM